MTGTRPSGPGQYTEIVILKTVVGAAPTRQSIFTEIEGGRPTAAPQDTQTLTAATHVAASIALPIPTNLDQSYKNDWSADTVGAIEKFVAGRVAEGLRGGGTVQDLLNGAYSQVPDLFKNELIRRGAQTPARLALRQQGLAANPYRELFYNGVELSQFTWEWEFAPTSEQESVRMEALFHALARAKHPDLLRGVGSSDATPYVIPDTFEVTFVNTKIPRHRSLALTDMSVRYANSGAGPKWIANGHPAFAALSLSFIETSPLTKRDIDELRQC